ncbi:Clp protease N-terminal domain-containing protein [Actinoplanes sp. CA-030573]|uniref:Clp protease N-terminal domain-containing protein n=1 Tax=Actinoplanes sp. CA-030573 TaxID=3239898 RepID=UPI003D8BA471
MFEKFTDRARRVVVLSQEEARLLTHDYIGTEHLLLGVIASGGDAARVLADAGVTAEPVRQEIIATIGLGSEPPGGHIPFTPPLKRSIEQAMREALRLGHLVIDAEHLLLGVLRQSDGAAVQILGKLGADPDELRRQVIATMAASSPDPSTALGASAAAGAAAPGPGAGAAGASVPAAATASAPFPFTRPLRGFAPAVPALDRFGRGIDPGALSPVVGRDAEVTRVVQILSRRERNNVALIGAPGSGRMAIATAVAGLIAGGAAPHPLRYKTLYAVDFALVPAGAEGRVETERRMALLLAEIHARRDLIVVTADFAPFGGDPLVAAFVRSALARGDLQMITTGSATNADISALFQQVEVVTPSAAEAVAMLEAIRPGLAAHHGVEIEDAALAAAAELAAGVLPGAAVDLLDEACARSGGGAVSAETVREAVAG